MADGRSNRGKVLRDCARPATSPGAAMAEPQGVEGESRRKAGLSLLGHLQAAPSDHTHLETVDVVKTGPGTSGGMAEEGP